MARVLRLAIAMFMTAVLGLSLNSCSESSLLGIEEAPVGPSDVKPIGWTVVDARFGDVIFDDGRVDENQEHALLFSAEDTIKVAGTERFVALEELYTEDVASEVKFQYNYGKVNTLTVNGLTLRYTYNGKTYDLPCLSELAIAGEHSTKEEETTPAYYELSETVYSLLADGKEILSTTQVFEVEEGYVPPTFDHVEWSYAHESFRREAEVAGTVVTVVCDNIANFADIYSDGSRQNVEEVSYTVSNKFNFNAPAMKVDDINTVVGRTFTFSNGTVNVAGQTVSAVWVSAAVDGKVMYNDKDYASEITPCKVEAKSITFVSANQAVVKFYDKDADDYAEATVEVSVSEKEAQFDHVEWSYSHKAFRREAEVAGTVVTVVCDNIANFADIYSDGSRQNVEEVSYTVSNKFNFNAPAMKVDDINTVVGRTFTFSNGTVNVAGQTVSAVWVSAAVDGKVMYNDKDYASEIVPCKVSARTITFVSANQAVVKFYDNNANDYAEATVAVVVEENRRLISVDDSYAHIAFRRNAVVNGAVIAVTCDNEASFVDNYSDGTTENENVNYTVVNNFNYVVPTFVVNNMSNLLGKSYSFNAGTAVVEGVNVSINFVRREVSAIMHNGKDYRSNTPQCEVVAKTITITSATTATVRFEDVDDSSDYSEAVININTLEAEIVVGQIMGAWITDAYQGRTLKSTDLHILAKQSDGSYVTYSREIGEMSFTTTKLSAAEGNSVLASGKALAWAYTPAGGRVLSLVDYIQSSKEQTGYVIDYLNFNGEVLIALGDAEAALNGVPFAEPVKAIGAMAEDGMWTISYNGTTYYFVSR